MKLIAGLDVDTFFHLLAAEATKAMEADVAKAMQVVVGSTRTEPGLSCRFGAKRQRPSRCFLCYNML